MGSGQKPSAKGRVRLEVVTNNVNIKMEVGGNGACIGGTCRAARQDACFYFRISTTGRNEQLDIKYYRLVLTESCQPMMQL